MDKRAKFLGNYQRQSKSRYIGGSLIVKLSSEKSIDAILTAGFRVGKPYGFGGYHKIRFQGDALEALEILSGIDGVENAELEILPEIDADFIPDDTYAPDQLDYCAALDVARMWDVYDAYRGSHAVYEQPVGVFDNRFDTLHEDVRWKLPGYNVMDGSDHTDIRPDESEQTHGTACAGLIGARTNNGAGIFGLGLNSSVYPLASVAYTADRLEIDFWTASVLKCLEAGIRVLSSSVSFGSHNEYIEAASNYARDNGLIICASAGNSSASSPRWPAAYDSVFGISGLAAVDGVGGTQIHKSANYGPGVDFCGPYETHSAANDNAFRVFTGTSAATPCVAACAANILSVNPALTWPEVKAIMARSCARESFQSDDPRQPALYGYGIPQFAKAVELAISSIMPKRGFYSAGGRIKRLYTGGANGQPVRIGAAYGGRPDGTPIRIM